MSLKNKEFISKMFIQCEFVINRIATPEWKIESAECPASNLVLVYDGQGVFTKNGVKKEVKCGDLVFFEKGCSRSMYSDTKNPIRFYTVNFSYVVPEYREGVWCLQYPELRFDFVRKISDTALYNRFVQLFENLCATHISAAQMRLAREREIMAKILEATMFLYETGAENYTNKLRTEKIIRCMYENFDKKLTLGMLAKEAGLSVPYFTATFKSITSVSPIDYLISVRIGKAKELLSSGSNVQTAAERCGFSDIFYFSRQFKKRENMTPTEFIQYAQKKYV